MEIKLRNFFLPHSVSSLRNKGFERNLLVVINALDLDLFENIDPSLLQLPSLLELSKPSSFFEFLLPGLPFGLLSPSVRESCTALLQHLLLVLIHINWIRPRWLSLGVRVDFSCTQLARVVRVLFSSSLGSVKKSLILIDTLSWCSPNQRSNRAPLRWKDLSQMQKLLFLLSRPLCLLNRWIKPFVPNSK